MNIQKSPKMLDNKLNVKVIDELRSSISRGANLSVISAYFTIYAYAELKKELANINSLKFIFTEPTFIKNDKELSREYYLNSKLRTDLSGNDFEIRLRNEMKQAAIAKECAAWLLSNTMNCAMTV